MITVCLAAYNGERFIVRQIQSILQSNRVTELLISDDGSTDATASIVEGLSDARIRLLRGPRCGVIRNVEFLLQQARGDYIFLADQDDVWLPRKVDVMTDALGTADLAICDCRVVDADLRELHPSFFELRGSRPGLLRNFLFNSYLGCCMALQRGLLEKVLPFPPNTPMHDWWIGLVAERFGSVAFVNEPLVLYRRHEGTQTFTAQRSRTSYLRRLQWRINLALALAARR